MKQMNAPPLPMKTSDRVLLADQSTTPLRTTPPVGVVVCAMATGASPEPRAPPAAVGSNVFVTVALPPVIIPPEGIPEMFLLGSVAPDTTAPPVTVTIKARTAAAMPPRIEPPSPMKEDDWKHDAEPEMVVPPRTGATTSRVATAAPEARTPPAATSTKPFVLSASPLAVTPPAPVKASDLAFPEEGSEDRGVWLIAPNPSTIRYPFRCRTARCRCPQRAPWRCCSAKSGRPTTWTTGEAAFLELPRSKCPARRALCSGA